MGDRLADTLRHPLGQQKRPLLVATGAERPLLTRKGHEHLVVAVGAPDASKAEVQVAAAEEFAYHVADELPLLHRIGSAIHGKDGNGIVAGSLSRRAIAEDRSPRVGQEGSKAGSRYGSRLQSILPIGLPKKGDFVSGTRSVWLECQLRRRVRRHGRQSPSRRHVRNPGADLECTRRSS